MLIFRHPDGKEVASPEQLQIWMKQTMDWIAGIAAQNKFVGGNGLPFDDARVVRSGNVVTNGPFGEAKDLIAGFWLWKVKSKEEAIEWVKRCPNPTGAEAEIEIRQVFEAEDFGAELTPELRKQEQRLRAQTSAKK